MAHPGTAAVCTADAEPEPVTVIRNNAVRATGRRLGAAIVYDWGFDHHGRQYEQRSFLLLDDGVQISQSVLFRGAHHGWWYCDLVRITDRGHEVTVDDLWIDVLVGPADLPYRVLDLDEFGVAVASGALSPAEAADALARLQRFLDRRLNRRPGLQPSWPDFPPESIGPLQHHQYPSDWSRFTQRLRNAS